MEGFSWTRKAVMRLAASALLAYGLLLACGQEVSSPELSVKDRFFDSHPTKEFRLEGVGSKEVVGDVPVVESGSEMSCRLLQMEVQNTGTTLENGVVLVATGSDPQLIFDVDLESGRIHEIVVDGKNLGPNVEIFWAGSMERFNPERMVAAKPEESDGSIHFSVGRNDMWRGRITKLRLDPTMVEGRRVQIRKIQLVGLSLDPQRLRQASLQPWLVTLGSETRPGMPADLGEPNRWKVEWKSGDRLTFGYGLMGGIESPVHFTVKDLSLPKQSSTVFSERLEPSRRAVGVWHEGTVVCSGEGGPTILEFEAELEKSDRLGGGVPVWGSPAILGKDSPRSRPNIILISIDTLRPDHLGVYGYDRRTSPHIDRLAANHGVVFETVVASAPWTLPSHISLFSGLDAVRHGINYGIPKKTVPLITQYLSDWGYTTVGITGGGYLSSQYGFATGFDSYSSWQGTAGSEGELTKGVDSLLRWLDVHGTENFFAFFHTYEVHSPYRPRAPYFAGWSEPAKRGFGGVVEARTAGYDEKAGYVGLNSIGVTEPRQDLRPLEEGELQLVIDCYDAGIAFTDEHLGRLFEYLESSRLMENTVVIVTSDHGEALGERGFFDHGRLHDPEILVPLIIAAPGRSANGGREARQVRLLDLAPTILDLARGDVPDDLDGVSLAPILSGQDVQIPEEAWSYTPKTNHGLALRTNAGPKLIFNNTAWSPAQGSQEWFDIEADPSKEHNIVDLPGIEEMRAKVFEHLERWERGIEIEIVNEESQVLTGSFSTTDSQILIVTRIKGVDIPENAVRVVDWRTVAFQAPPGSRFTVVAEDLLATSLHLEGRPDDPVTGTLAADIDLSSPDSQGFVVYDRGAWMMRSESPENGGTWIRAAWRNSGPGESPNRPQEDSKVLDQLRALGYVE
ncbi:MAG: sulfatase-like hydrolase/transferase [Thermoanaerobaculales bacterium]|nr:sulfatase-like hydrolase/transferase [Thermoanaerobaculales bacterium]